MSSSDVQPVLHSLAAPAFERHFCAHHIAEVLLNAFFCKSATQATCTGATKVYITKAIIVKAATETAATETTFKVHDFII